MFFAFVKGNCGNFFAGGRLFVAGSTLPPLYPAGGVLSLSPANPANPALAGGLAFLLARRPCL